MSAAPEGPQPRELLTCKGCKHFLSEYWKEPSGDGETYDSGTSAKCLKSDRWIASYGGSDPAPPDWCPCADLPPAPDIGALDVDALAQIIRRVDGENRLGAGTLAEAIIAALADLKGGAA